MRTKRVKAGIKDRGRVLKESVKAKEQRGRGEKVEKESEIYLSGVEALRRAIKHGMDSGEPTPLDIGAVKARGRKRLEHKKQRLGQFIAKGIRVFGSEESFNAWLHAPCLALGNKTPIEMLDSTAGLDLVEGVIVCIEHGVYS
jgi:Arc/MetJ-type ribon-helix-helix transcriptional regulator